MTTNPVSHGKVEPRWRWGRVAVLIPLGLLAATALWVLKHGGPQMMPWTCLLHDMTGLHCPGCGMTRATDALLDGDLTAAVSFNPLGIILLPVALIALIPELIGWLRGSPPLWRVPLGKRGAWIIAWLVISFAVLRNIPFAPFSWLAPG